MIDDRLARAALRGVLQELEDDAAGAGEVLARVLGAPRENRDAKPRDRDLKPANVPHRDVKPGNIERPAARRPVAESRRPAPAPSVVTRTKKPTRSVAAISRRGVIDPEVARMAAALIKKHGSALAAAPHVPTSAPMLRRWARGKACWPETVDRLRKALELRPVGNRDAKPGKQEKNTTRPAARRRAPAQRPAPAVDLSARPLSRALAGQPSVEDTAPPAPVLERTEAARLVEQLAARHGDLATAAERCGFGDAALMRWAGGGACSPRALERLRDAVGAPLGRVDAARRQEASAAAGDESAAGAGDAA